jgi:hypothetical protein
MGMRDRRWVNATSHQAGDVSHVHHEIGADGIGDLAEALPVPDTGIGGTTGEDELGLVLMGEPLDLVHIQQVIIAAHAVRHDVEPLAAHVDRRTMGQVPARIEIKAHERIAGLQQRQEHGLVHLRAGIGLDVGEVGAEQLLGTLDGEGLGDIDELAAAVIALAGITFSILVGHDRALRLEHGAGHDVLGGDQFDLVLLAAEFVTDGAGDLWVGLSQGVGEEPGKQRG